MKNLVRLSGAVVTAMVLCFALSSTPVFSSAVSAPAVAGATINVNSTSDIVADDGQCTLREALSAAANDAPSGVTVGECAAGSGDDTININVTGVINLTDMLSTTTNVSIVGPGSGLLTLRSTGSPHRVFFANVSTVGISGLTMTNGSFPPGGGSGGGLINGSGIMTLTDVVITGNHTPDGLAGNPSAGSGGGIVNSGALTLINCVVSGNGTGNGVVGTFENGQGGRGGGIDSGSGRLTLINSVVSGNGTGGGPAKGGDGGGIFVGQFGATLINTTVSGNSNGAGGSGGGVFAAFGSLTLTNSTVTANSGLGVSYSADFENSPQANVRNTIIAGNGSGGSGPDVSGTFNSQGHNLIGNVDTATGFNSAGDMAGTSASPINPRLGPLADNGGPTKTHALLAGSPALDAGDNSLAKDLNNNALTTDQRGMGFARFADSADADTTQTVDIGAFEANPTVEDISDKTMSEGASLSFNFNVGDAALGSLSVAASSSNTSLVPNDASHISVSGAGSQRMLNVTPAAGTHGTTTITVTVTAANGRTASDTFVLTVLNVTTISAVSGSGVYGGTATLTATLSVGGSGLAGKSVAFTLSGNPVGSASTNAGGVATLAGVSLSGVNAGTYAGVVGAAFAGDANFTAAGGTGALSVSKAATTTAVTVSNATYDGNPHGGSANVTGPAGLSRSLTVSYVGRNSTVYGPSNTAPTNAGDYTASASYAGDSNYNASSDSKDYSIAKASQTITFGALADKTYGDADFTISATASSGLPVSFGAMGSCTVSDSTVHITGAGSCRLTATQFGDSNYTGAVGVARDFNIAQASTSVAVSSSANPSAVGQSVTFTATVTSPAGFVPSGIFGVVNFFDGGVSIPNCASLLNSGQAACTTSALTPGRHTITAEYGTISQSFTGSTGTLQGGQTVGSVFEFSQSAYEVAEGTSLVVAVTRSGDTSQAVSVGYATDDGSTPSVVVPCSSVTGIALDRCDFTKARGTLNFAAGETQKTFLVFGGDDSYTEGPESARLRLSNPSAGSALGALAEAAFTIDDDSPESSGNPSDDDEKFVAQHYRDFLNRDPDAPGLAFWKGQLASCGSNAQCREVKRVNVSAAFFLSIEFQQTGFFVYKTYKAAYGDATSPGVAGTVPVIRLEEFLPDTQRVGQGVVVGQGNWQQQLDANQTALLRDFVQRQRFTTAFPASLTAAQLVDKVARNAGLTLTQTEHDQLAALLGTTPADASRRAELLRAVTGIGRLHEAETNRAFVLMEYYGYLRRNPDDAPEPTLNFAGWKFWLDKLNSFGGNYIQAEMVKAFISSDEYRHRFGR